MGRYANRGGKPENGLSCHPFTDLNWKLVGVEDYAGDGRTDLLWRKVVTGQKAIWDNGDVATGHLLFPLNADWIKINTQSNICFSDARLYPT